MCLRVEKEAYMSFNGWLSTEGLNYQGLKLSRDLLKSYLCACAETRPFN